MRARWSASRLEWSQEHVRLISRKRFCVGTAKGPGETPHEYTFVTPDADRDGQERRIRLLRGAGRRRDAPDRRARHAAPADPALPGRLHGRPARAAGGSSPACWATTPGQHELFEITVRILGYYDAGAGRLHQPAPAAALGPADLSVRRRALSQILSKRKLDERGGAHVGSLLSRRPDACRS